MKRHLSLFRKDLVLQKKTIPLSIITVFGLLFINRMSLGSSGIFNPNFITAVFIVSSMITTTSLIQDDKNNVLMMLSGLPFSRNQLVLNRYIFSVLNTLLAGVLFGVIFNLIRAYVGQNQFMSTVTVSDFLFAIAVINLYFLSVFPLYFKLGYTKTQMFNMLILVVMMMVSAIVAMHMPAQSTQQPTHTNTATVSSALYILSMAVCGASFILYFFSYKISVWLYKKREF